MTLENCKECPHVADCDKWKATQLEQAATPEIRVDLREILKNFCLITSSAADLALRSKRHNPA